MLYVVDTIPTLLLDEIRHCPLLYYCVTDITQNSHMILYQVVGRAKKKNQRWDSSSLTLASYKVGLQSRETHRTLVRLYHTTTTDDALPHKVICPTCLNQWRFPISLGCKMTRQLRLETSFKITKNYLR